jgi:hypothetical protein
VNANAPASIAGLAVLAGDSSADQYADNSASSDASNYATTDQSADQSQDSSDSCAIGCGGSGQFQAAAQLASTYQEADSSAYADQNAVNANAPVSTAGLFVIGGDSSASQDATNSADSSASNDASTTQDADQSQSSSDSCLVGCGGSGQAQLLLQAAETNQYADSEANADQHLVNANAPASIAGLYALAGDSSADQSADNSATSDASNDAATDQTGSQYQDPTGGSGQFQLLAQLAATYQEADSAAYADQNAVNADAGPSASGYATDALAGLSQMSALSALRPSL